MSNTIYIVDPLSSGSYLAPRIHENYGLKTSAILSSSTILPGLESSFHPGHFENVISGDSVEEIIKQIRVLEGGKKPFALICGSEPGVELYDVLTQEWDLSPNVPSLSQARRDKFLMQDRLKEKGLAYIPHLKSGDPEEIRDWCQKNPNNTFVVKPLKSFGSDSVYFTDTPEETETVARRLLGVTNLSGAVNDELLVQRYIHGTEYVVDAVTNEGKHSIVDIFQYEKENVDGNPIYRTMKAVNPSEFDSLVTYIFNVLDALGIKSGPSHSEVFMTETGPVLVESGARMHGGQGPKLAELAFSRSLIDETIKSRVPGIGKGQSFDSILVSNAVECFLSSNISGVVTATHLDELLLEIPSFIYHTVTLSAGKPVQKTVDLLSSYGRVVLCNQDPEQLNKDLHRVQILDRTGKFLDVEFGEDL